jgi:hypothetical protein
MPGILCLSKGAHPGRILPSPLRDLQYWGSFFKALQMLSFLQGLSGLLEFFKDI